MLKYKKLINGMEIIVEELNLIIANNICGLRTAAEMTQSELAQKLNYSDKLISKWERGDAAPNAQTLKRLSEIFDVSIDYIFEDHREADDEPPAPRKFYRHIVAWIAFCGIWLISVLIFIILWILSKPVPEIFVYTIPISIITLLVMNSVWNKGRHNYSIIALLILSIILSIYIALLRFNPWQIFILLIPAELIVLLCAKLKRKKGE